MRTGEDQRGTPAYDEEQLTYFAQRAAHFTGKLPRADFQVEYFAAV